MTTRARAEFDAQRFGVRVVIRHEIPGGFEYLRWEPMSPIVASDDVELDGSAWLRLLEDDARALYEALADYFGHAGHDARALRKDYEAERARVDLLIRRITS